VLEEFIDTFEVAGAVQGKELGDRNRCGACVLRVG
jgi:hypothetical protein